ncbi:MAG: carbamoylphosphate synthase large subunit [Thermodesulfobacteriota bacterium]
MPHRSAFPYADADSFTDLYRADADGMNAAFLLAYPSTSRWSPYPNTRKYFIQDGSFEEKKVPYAQIRQKEPWKILSVLGDGLPGLATCEPPELLLRYWRDQIGFGYRNLEVLPHPTWADVVNRNGGNRRLITLFPYDHVAPERHAIDPDRHYWLLSKCALSELCPFVPDYKVIDLRRTPLDRRGFPRRYPFAVKTSHGLSGEGTYIIQNDGEMAACLTELRAYLRVGTLESLVVMVLVGDVVDNYCVQFYVDGGGGAQLLGATHQMVSAAGAHLGGLIRYHETDLRRFSPIIAEVAAAVHRHGYFGVVGVDVLEDRAGELFVIDVNVRVNGSTPLCLLRRRIVESGRDAARYSTGYLMEGDLDDVLVRLKPVLDREAFFILSALERPVSNGGQLTEIYGVVTGVDLEELEANEARLAHRGLVRRK